VSYRPTKLASLAFCAFTSIGTAVAADMPVKAPPIAAPPPAFTWTGCYLGGYVGGAWSDRDPVFTDLGNANFRSFSGGITAGRIEGSHSWSVSSDSSVIAGGTLGCNWQVVGSPFVFGIEGEGGYLRLEGSTFDPLLSPVVPLTALRTTPDVLGGARVGDWYAMITGRLGYAWDRVLIYAKGGAAFVPVRASVVDSCATAGCGNWLLATSVSDTVTTWTIGGGIEWAFTDNWSIKGEYMFIGLDDTFTTCAPATLASGAVVSGGPFCFGHDFNGIHTAKIGVNYRFGQFWR